MKKIITLVVVALISSHIYSQNSFNLTKVDSISKTKNQIYSDTKSYIAKTWRSAQDVIQNDDKEGGVIIVKGAVIKHIIVMGMQDYCYTYRYTVIFQMKDNKYKISIQDVVNEKAVFMTNPTMYISLVQPFEGDNAPKGTMMNPIPSSKKVIPMMNEIKDELKAIMAGYEIKLLIKSETNKEW